MWDALWYLGFPMFAMGVFGSPYKYRDDDADVVYDQRQNGTENYKLNVDGLSLVWTQNSLLAAAALLEPALYGEYPEPGFEVVLGPGEPPNNKTTHSENEVRPINGTVVQSEPAVLVLNGLNNSDETNENNAKKKLKIADFLRPFLRRRS